MKNPIIKKLQIPGLLKKAAHLECTGKLAISNNNLVYLDVIDEYIHQLFPLLQNAQVQKPNYFLEGGVGAHITVIYPEENKVIKQTEFGKKHYFTIRDVVTAEVDLKTYYVILIESASLLQIRRKYSLPDLLCFRGYAIEFHITIGVSF